MILLMLYLGLCLSTSLVAFITTYNMRETMAWSIGCSILSFVLAPIVWVMAGYQLFVEACDLSDVRRGVRVPKSHRIEHDPDWFEDYLKLQGHSRHRYFDAEPKAVF